MPDLVNTNQSVPQQPVMQNPPPAQPGKKRLWVIISLVLLLIIAGSIGYYVLTSSNDGSKNTTQDSKKGIFSLVKPKLNPPQATPTPMPFRDMTIPYLREQTYTSTLGELEITYDGSSYTAYTTSYTSDGLRVNGLLTQPKGEPPSGGWPAIVFVHGYIPPASYETQGQAYSSYVDYLANSGLVVFKIDLRGHGNSEGQPGGAYYSSDYIIDLLNAYAALENANFVNPKKIGVWGHSMAGNITMRSWAVKKTIPAVVIWAGAGYTYEDLIKYRITDASFQPQANNAQRLRRRQEIYEKYGSPSAKVKFWQEVTPVSYLSELNGAIQLHHAVDDDVVNVAYSRDLNELFEKTSLPNEYYEYPSGGHNISGASYNEAMQRTTDFFKEHLQ